MYCHTKFKLIMIGGILSALGLIVFTIALVALSNTLTDVSIFTIKYLCAMSFMDPTDAINEIKSAQNTFALTFILLIIVNIVNIVLNILSFTSMIKSKKEVK